MFTIHWILPRKAEECHSSTYFLVRCAKPNVVMDKGECTVEEDKVTCGICIKGER